MFFDYLSICLFIFQLKITQFICLSSPSLSVRYFKFGFNSSLSNGESAHPSLPRRQYYITFLLFVVRPVEPHDKMSMVVLMNDCRKILD